MKSINTSYIVKRAIIVAAGVGNRLFPLTRDVPKPLIVVNGKRMIDTVIEALHVNEINEIYVVVGYLKEKFQYLADIPGLTLIENPYYSSSNNIASLYVAREYLEEAMILDGDQIIYNPSILTPEFERSCYNVVWTENETKEWLLTIENGMVSKCSRSGGERGWQLYSISRWTKEDGQRLREHLEIEFVQKRNTQIYWDDVALFCYPEEYHFGIYEMVKEDIVEIDSIEELVAIDMSYRYLLEDVKSE